jgi:hypothetical protein
VTHSGPLATGHLPADVLASTMESACENCVIHAARPGHRSGTRSESVGVRSTVVRFHVIGVQTVEEVPDRTLGCEHVKGHMLPLLRNDLAFAFRL